LNGTHQFWGLLTGGRSNSSELRCVDDLEHFYKCNRGAGGLERRSASMPVTGNALVKDLGSTSILTVKNRGARGRVLQGLWGNTGVPQHSFVLGNKRKNSALSCSFYCFWVIVLFTTRFPERGTRAWGVLSTLQDGRRSRSTRDHRGIAVPSIEPCTRARAVEGTSDAAPYLVASAIGDYH